MKAIHLTKLHPLNIEAEEILGIFDGTIKLVHPDFIGGNYLLKRSIKV